MTRAKELVLPGYLLLCLLIGGSSQAIWGNALLQLLAVAILGWVAFTAEPRAMPTPARRLLLIAGAGLAVILLQVIPLPPALWTRLPGREFVETGLGMIGAPLPWLPISLAPYDTMAAALTLLPPAALLVGMLRLRSWNGGLMFAAAFLGAAISIFLGMLQVTSHDGSWYFYRRTNIGVAVGAFANGNHFATLLLATLPLAAALAVGRWRSAAKQSDRSLTVALAIAAGTVLAIGVLINGSSAMLLLGLPVAAASAMIAMRLSRRSLRLALVGIAALLLAATAAVVVLGETLPRWGTSASIETRTEYWSTSLQVARDQRLSGSGIGTFPQIYARYEDPGEVDRWYVNHAHNDYLELAVEGGAAAAILILAFLWWWLARCRDAWTSSTALEQKAAAVTSAAILLHSLFDFPLRTAAIAALFAMCLALLAGARGSAGKAGRDEREQVRHATL